jgi:hypothetical protein
VDALEADLEDIIKFVSEILIFDKIRKAWQSTG